MATPALTRSHVERWNTWTHSVPMSFNLDNVGVLDGGGGACLSALEREHLRCHDGSHLLPEEVMGPIMCSE